MSSDCSASLDDNVHVVQKKKLGGRSSISINKKDGTKVLRKIHKSEREKLKRDHMNDLFLELSKALEPTNQNNGKSSTLTNTIRIIKDLFAQIEVLKEENSTLLAESQYVRVENNELKEENSATETEISKLKARINERVHSQSSSRSDPSSLHNSHTPQFLENNVILPLTDTATQKTSFVGSVFVIPLQNEPKLCPEPWFGAAERPTNVSKPNARYPSPSHNWPFKFLSEQPRVD